MDVRVLSEQGPVEPTGLIVLTVRIIVAVLRSPHFIAHHKHWQTKRKESHGQEILYLAVSKFFNRRVIGWPFGSTVPTSIVACAVAVALSVRLVVLFIVRNKIVERKSIMTCHEVYAFFCLALLVTIDIVAPDHPVRKTLQRTVFASEETTYVITEAPVPFPPAIPNKTADLVQSGCIPSLGDYLCPCKGRIGINVPKNRGIRHHRTVGITRKDRSEIETETVHVHHCNPVAETVHDHSANNGMIGVERIPCAAEIRVI